jgi:hypothetical protein
MGGLDELAVVAAFDPAVGARSMIRHGSIFEPWQQPNDYAARSRRSWLIETLLGTLVVTFQHEATGAGETGEDADEAKEIVDIQSSAKKVGLEPFAISRTKHFLCLGNAPDKFRGSALGICESLSEAFLLHFRQRGFSVAIPPHRATVIALKDDASYRAYIGEDPGEGVGGHYDLDTNRLVIFDFRPKRAELAAEAERVNLFTLVHETTHVLCFNTGLLSRAADVPVSISEGLATYVELWRPGGKGRIGGPNRPWLDAIVDARRKAEPWIPISEVLANDDLCRNEETRQLAYAESWLLVHYLMTARRAKFQAYLGELPAGDPAAKRIKYAEERLGPLKTLDRDVVRHAQKLMR